MKTSHIVDELRDVAERLGLEVRTERGAFRGGRCRKDGADLIVLNKRQPVEAHLAILAESLKEFDLDDVFVKPAVRKALQESWESRSGAAVDETDFADADDA